MNKKAKSVFLAWFWASRVRSYVRGPLLEQREEFVEGVAPADKPVISFLLPTVIWFSATLCPAKALLEGSISEDTAHCVIGWRIFSISCTLLPLLGAS